MKLIFFLNLGLKSNQINKYDDQIEIHTICTGPGQLNHINDNPHIYVGNNPSTRLGLAWTQTHN